MLRATMLGMGLGRTATAGGVVLGVVRGVLGLGGMHIEDGQAIWEMESPAVHQRPP